MNNIAGDLLWQPPPSPDRVETLVSSATNVEGVLWMSNHHGVAVLAQTTSRVRYVWDQDRPILAPRFYVVYLAIDAAGGGRSLAAGSLAEV